MLELKDSLPLELARTAKRFFCSKKGENTKKGELQCVGLISEDVLTTYFFMRSLENQEKVDKHIAKAFFDSDKKHFTLKPFN